MVLDTVASQVNSSAGNFNPKSIAQQIAKDHINLDASNLVDKVKENQANKNKTSANLAALVSDQGINWFSSESKLNQPLQLEYGSLKRETDGTLIDQEFIYDYALQSFQPSSNPIDEGAMLLDRAGWTALNDTITQLVPNKDKSVTIVKGSSVLNEKATAQQVDVGGLNVSNILSKTAGEGAWSQVVPAGLVFPDNTTAYKLKTDFVTDGYYGFQKGDWCKGTPRYTELNNMCNGVSANNISTWLATLDETLAQDVSDRSGGYDTSDLPVMGAFDELGEWALYAQLLPGGGVVYYSGSKDVELSRFAQKGKWEDVTVFGKTIRKVTLPEAIASQTAWNNYNPADNSTYFAEVEGFVRITWFVELASSLQEEYIFDLATQQFILNNFSQPLN